MSFIGSHVVLPHISRTGRPRVQGIPATYLGKRVPSRTFRGQTVRTIQYASGKTAVVSEGKKSRSKVMAKYAKKNKKRKGIIKKRIPATLTPKRKMVRCTVVDYLTTNGTTGALDAITVSVNDITDPFGADGANQPLGYDQWKALYKQAVVVGLKLTVRAHNSTSYPVMVGMTTVPASQASTALTSYEHYMELPSTKSRILSPDVDHITFFKKVSTKKYFGIKKLMDEEEIHCTNLTAETAPTREGQVHIWVQPLDQATTLNPSAQLVVKAEYLILLHDPIIPSRSAV